MEAHLLYSLVYLHLIASSSASYSDSHSLKLVFFLQGPV